MEKPLGVMGIKQSKRLTEWLNEKKGFGARKNLKRLAIKVEEGESTSSLQGEIGETSCRRNWEKCEVPAVGPEQKQLVEKVGLTRLANKAWGEGHKKRKVPAKR